MIEFWDWALPIRFLRFSLLTNETCMKDRFLNLILFANFHKMIGQRAVDDN